MTFLLRSGSGNHSTATKSNPNDPACLTHSFFAATSAARLPAERYVVDIRVAARPERQVQPVLKRLSVHASPAAR
jgi:hypothetical protein